MRKIKYGIAIVLNMLLISGIFNACVNGDGELGDTIFVFIVLILLIIYNFSLLFMTAFFYKNESHSKAKELLYILFYLWPVILYGILSFENII